ncbi:hypothetical protein Dsin_013516 [Dipteronia sinensis]|uniref:Reverse transcriptase zinc-binding domain-containing protein n=1 Tax=Dipteronia sinensis TaxID=43782 RepID=A0AAE0E929_9ROSI|nr:hypothetical protein Dsin_013516 [Dipteronia sinensis]
MGKEDPINASGERVLPVVKSSGSRLTLGKAKKPQPSKGVNINGEKDKYLAQTPTELNEGPKSKKTQKPAKWKRTAREKRGQNEFSDLGKVSHLGKRGIAGSEEDRQLEAKKTKSSGLVLVGDITLVETKGRIILGKESRRRLKRKGNVSSLGKVYLIFRILLCSQRDLFRVVRGCRSRLPPLRNSIFLEASKKSSDSLVWQRGWDVPRIKHHFTKDEASIILSIPLGSNRYKDTLMWHFEDCGNYSVRSGCKIGRDLTRISSSSNISAINSWWKTFWKIQIPLKIKIFIWKAWHNWIPTRVNLAKRGIKLDRKCQRCFSEDEFTFHALWNCRKPNYVRRDWAELHRGSTGSFTNLGDFIYNNYMKLSLEDMGLLCVIVWRTWYSKNSFLFDSKRLDIQCILSWCKNFLSNYSISNAKISTCSGSPDLVHSFWSPPNSGSFKINCMAITDSGNRSTGFGIVIRNHDGLVLSSYILFSDTGLEFLQGNLVAILRGLNFGKRCGFLPFYVESDAVTVVRMINNGSHLNSSCGNIICDITSLMKVLCILFISLGKRGSNTVASDLAKQALRRRNDLAWKEGFLNWIPRQILNDQQI